MEMIDSAYLIQFFRRAADRLEDARQYLCVLDGEVGDGDHGTSMANGFAAICTQLREISSKDPAPDEVLRQAANAFLAEVGATAGPLYANAMLSAAQRLAEAPLQRRDLSILLGDMADGIVNLGHAEPGDKTMIDAWRPAALAAAAAERRGENDAEIAAAAAEAARKGAEATTTMVAARGRAARLKERSLGHVDPGAASAAILIGVFASLSEDSG